MLRLTTTLRNGIRTVYFQFEKIDHNKCGKSRRKEMAVVVCLKQGSEGKGPV
jgi:hypothetical protein